MDSNGNMAFALLDRLPAHNAESGNATMVIETPRGNRAKFKYSLEHGVFRLHKMLPLGNAFPFHFGFIPSTRTDDGDPLDVLLLLDEPMPQGSVVEIRILGAIEATQWVSDKPPVRNDRLVSVATHCDEYNRLQDLPDLDAGLLAQIEQFFIGYNALEGKRFNPIGHADKVAAGQILQRGMDSFAEKRSAVFMV